MLAYLIGLERSGAVVGRFTLPAAGWPMRSSVDLTERLAPYRPKALPGRKWSPGARYPVCILPVSIWLPLAAEAEAPRGPWASLSPDALVANAPRAPWSNLLPAWRYDLPNRACIAFTALETAVPTTKKLITFC